MPLYKMCEGDSYMDQNYLIIKYIILLKLSIVKRLCISIYSVCVCLADNN